MLYFNPKTVIRPFTPKRSLGRFNVVNLLSSPFAVVCPAALAQSLHHLALLIIHLLYLLLSEEFAELLIVFVPDVEHLLASLEALAHFLGSLLFSLAVAAVLLAALGCG